MTDSGSNTGTGERTFTQADVNRMVADERRRLEQKFADYDDLKKDAADARKAADAQKSDIDKLTDAVRTLTERASESEASLARRDAAEKYHLPAKFARKLTAKTPEDAEREAKELADELKELGVKLGGGKDDGKGGGADGAGAGDGDGKGSNTGGGSGSGATGQDGGGDGAGNTGTGNGAAGNGGGRTPRETLRSGTAGAGSGNTGDEDPAKVADKILGNRIF